MAYEVDVDGSISPGKPSGQVLASVTGLTQGDHTISVTVSSSARSPGDVLSFESALVTVGTGRTG